MKPLKLGRRALMASAVAALSLGTPAFAGGHQVVESIHFLIPRRRRFSDVLSCFARSLTISHSPEIRIVVSA